MEKQNRNKITQIAIIAFPIAIRKTNVQQLPRE